MAIVDGTLANATNFNAAFASKSNANTFSNEQTMEKEVILKEIATPANPSSGYGKIYFKSDGELYAKNDSGTESQVSNQTTGSGIISVASKTATYTANTTDDLLLVGASSASWTLSLFTAVGNTGKILRIKRTDNTIANDVTIDPNSTETIDGATSYKLDLQNQEIQIVSDGSNWVILNKFTPFVGFSAKSSSIVSSSSGSALVIPTEIFDTHSSYNAGTGIFTAPTSGYYTFGLHGFQVNSGSSDPSLSIYKNSSEFHLFGYLDTVTGGGGAIYGSSVTLSLVKGDQIYYALGDGSGLYANSSTRGPFIECFRHQD